MRFQNLQKGTNRTLKRLKKKGPFIFKKNFLNNSRDLSGQYPILTRGKATKFLEQHRFLMKKDGFLTSTQSKAIEDYTKSINILEGKIKQAAEAGSNPVMFLQLNQNLSKFLIRHFYLALQNDLKM